MRTIELTPEAEQFADACVAAGEFADVSAVAQAAFDALRERQAERAAFVQCWKTRRASRPGRLAHDRGGRGDDGQHHRECRNREGEPRQAFRPRGSGPEAGNRLDRSQGPSCRNAAARQRGTAVRRIGDRPMLGRIEPRYAPQNYRFWSITGFPYLLVYDRPRRRSGSSASSTPPRTSPDTSAPCAPNTRTDTSAPPSCRPGPCPHPSATSVPW